MITPDIKIPREVVEAVAERFALFHYHKELSSLEPFTQAVPLALADAALTAALNAWPGMEIEMVGEVHDFLILPLPQEVGDE